MNARRILITGSRHWTDRAAIQAAIERELAGYDGEVVIVHGDAPGADRLAGEVALALGCWAEVHPADWTTGRRAGPVRNQRMVDRGADVCLAFPASDSRGTWDCVRRAKKAGIRVVVSDSVSPTGKPRFQAD